MARKAESYGLPELTFKAAADTLGITEADFIEWLLVEVKPSPARWTEWTKGTRHLPERLIRLYIKTKGESAARRAIASGSADWRAPIHAKLDDVARRYDQMTPEEQRENIAHLTNQIGLLFRERRTLEGAPEPPRVRRKR